MGLSGLSLERVPEPLAIKSKPAKGISGSQTYFSWIDESSRSQH
jgi:hypothetical protein